MSSSDSPLQLPLFPDGPGRPGLIARLRSLVSRVMRKAGSPLLFFLSTLVLLVWIEFYLGDIYFRFSDRFSVGWLLDPVFGYDLDLIAYTVFLSGYFYLRRRPAKRDDATLRANLLGLTCAALIAVVFFRRHYVLRYAEAEYRPWLLYTAGVIACVYLLLKIPRLQLAPWKGQLSTSEYLTLENSTRTSIVQIVGGLVVILGLYFTAQSLNATQENVKNSLLQAESERLDRAVTQLTSDKLEPRLVALYGLRKLGGSSYENYTLVVKILTNYVRGHAQWQEQNGKPAPPAGQRFNLPTDLDIAVSFITSRGIMVGFIRKEFPFLSIGRNEEDLDRYVRFIAQQIDLNGTDLRGLRLTGAVLTGANLSGAHLDRASIYQTDFADADLTGAVLRGSHFYRSNFQDAKLINANLQDCDLEDVSFEDADLAGADFTGAQNLTAGQLAKAKNVAQATLPAQLQAAPRADSAAPGQ